LEKQDWYFVAGVLMWLMDKIVHYLERKEEKEKTNKNKTNKRKRK